MTTGLSIRQLNRFYGSNHVLRDIELEVEPSGFTVLLGPSGCGKSTLLATIAGLDRADSGTILIGGQDVTVTEPDKRGISMVFQSYALYPTMTVRRNLSFGLRVAGLPGDEINTRVAWAAKLLQLEPLLDRKPAELSGGQRQRVAIGRALVRQENVCLFDEPLSNLDAKLRTEMRAEIKRLHTELGQTIVYVTHDQVEAMTMATRIAVMNRGVVEQYADPETLYEFPETLFVAGFVGAPSMNFLAGRTIAGDTAPALEVAGATLPLSGYRFREAPGQREVVFGIRPEHIRVGGDGPGMTARYVSRETHGADTLVWFARGREAKLAVRMDPAEAREMTPGEYFLAMNPSRYSVFDAQTERRL